MKKKIIIISVGLVVLTAVVLLFCGLVDKLCHHNSLTVADWLAASCSILSLIGTTALAIVAVWQTEKANKQNEALLEQNTELQKINDRQFKIANQQFYPLLGIGNIHVSNEHVGNNIPLDNWKNGVIKTWEKNVLGSIVRIDARDHVKGAYNQRTSVGLEIKNSSEAIIKEIEIYKYICSAPIESGADVYWPLFTFTFSSNTVRALNINLYHNREVCTDKGDILNLCLFLKVKTITDVTFYEKIHLYLSKVLSLGEIESISDKELID